MITDLGTEPPTHSAAMVDEVFVLYIYLYTSIDNSEVLSILAKLKQSLTLYQ